MTPTAGKRARPVAGKWVGGLAEWTEGETAYLSIAFTWHIREARARAQWWRALGYHVIAGGPALFLPKMRRELDGLAEIPTRQVLVDGKLVEGLGVLPGAVERHNPDACTASRGCPVGCSFCIVPAMEGLAFTLLPDFKPRPILCDNNLSALPADYQDFIIARYRAARPHVPLLDANSGFEPRTFDDEVFARWRAILKGPWRFAFDEQREAPDVERVMRMLRAVPKRRKRVYVLIGNEPIASCMDRIARVQAWGGEPHVQPYYSLTALEKRPRVRFDWTEQHLTDVARWANWSSRSGIAFADYDRSARSSRTEQYNAGTGLFE